MIKGLTPKTEKVFLSLSELDFIKDYTLVGGTALSIQLQTRLSEDLDFMKWKRTKNERAELPWDKIKSQLSDLGLGKVKSDVLDFNQVLFEIADVKLSFYFRDSYAPEGIKAIPFMGTVRVADVFSIGIMKIDAMLRRCVFRDYYDLYSILKYGADINQLIDKAAKYSGHATRIKNITAIISGGDRFSVDERFNTLEPIYNISGKEIEDFIKKEIGKNKENIFTEQEVPINDFSKLGLSFHKMDQENKELLLNGELSNKISLNMGNIKGEKVDIVAMLSLKRNSDNSVSLICHYDKNKIGEN